MDMHVNRLVTSDNNPIKNVRYVLLPTSISLLGLEFCLGGASAAASRSLAEDHPSIHPKLRQPIC